MNEKKYRVGKTRWGGTKKHLGVDYYGMGKYFPTVCGASAVDDDNSELVTEVAHLKEVDCKNCRATHAFKTLWKELGAEVLSSLREGEMWDESPPLTEEEVKAHEETLAWARGSTLSTEVKRPKTLRYTISVVAEVPVDTPAEVEELIDACNMIGKATVEKVEVL